MNQGRPCPDFARIVDMVGVVVLVILVGLVILESDELESDGLGDLGE